MSRPSAENIRVSLEELRNEAKEWSSISADAKSAHRKIDEATDLNALEMGIFAPGYFAYDNIRTKLLSLLEGASAEADSISTTLVKVADKYQEEDTVHAGQSQSIHEQLQKW